MCLEAKTSKTKYSVNIVLKYCKLLRNYKSLKTVSTILLWPVLLYLKKPAHIKCYGGHPQVSRTVLHEDGINSGLRHNMDSLPESVAVNGPTLITKRFWLATALKEECHISMDGFMMFNFLP
jgi:hypothetical protein